MGLGRAVASPVLSRAARQVLPLLPQLRSVPEVIGFSVVHALARCFAGEAWCRASAVVLLVAAVAAVGPAQLLAALPAWPVRVCARLAPALVRRKVTSLLLCLLAPTAWREVAVLGRVLPLQAAYLWTALRIRSARLSGDAAEAAWDATHAWATPRIRALLDDFGGFLRKIGQMLGTATPSMPPALLAAFADSMDNAAGLPFWQVKRIIERELRAPIGQIFASLDETPAATASIAQVHFGTLASDGSAVAVKVACVGSKGKMLSDMRTMLRVAVALHRFGLDGGLDLPTIMRAYWDIVPDEFDLRIEAAKMARFSRAFARAGLVERIGIARAHADLATARVLVMEKLVGTRMLEVVRAACALPDRGLPGAQFPPCPPEVVRVHGSWAGLVNSLHLAFGTMVLVEGTFHTDPHPGNLLVLDDGRLGILDWGQTKRLRADHVRLLCRMTLAMAAERYAQIEALIEGSGEFALEELVGRSPLEKRMAWVLICYTFVDTRWTPLSDLTFADAPASGGILGKNRLSRNSQEAFPLIRAVFLLRGLMASLGVSTSMAVAWEPIARRVLLQSGVAVEPMPLVLARRAAARVAWVAMRWLVALVQLVRGRTLHEPSAREQKALVAVGARDAPPAPQRSA